MSRLPRLTVTRIVLLLAAIAVGYVLFAAVNDALLSRELNRDEDRLRQEIADLERQQAELEAIREYLLADEYIEGVARRVLGLVRPGETLVIVSSDAPASPTAEPTPGDPEGDLRPWWERLYEP